MTDSESPRLRAWNHELQRAHVRLREALRVTREALATGAPEGLATRDLLLYCHGFCTALDGHHHGEDRALFPAIEAAHPHLAPVLRRLTHDHAMIGSLIHDLLADAEQSARPEELDRHLEGIAAVMESHFRYEERQLSEVLATLEVDASRAEALGPL